MTGVRLGNRYLGTVPTGLHRKPIFPGESGLLGNGLLAQFGIVTIDAKSGRLFLGRGHSLKRTILLAIAAAGIFTVAASSQAVEPLLSPRANEQSKSSKKIAATVCAAVFWRPIQQRWLTWLVLRAEAPAQSLVDGLIARDRHSGALLSRFWSTEKIPHRLAVLDYLQTHRASGIALRVEETAILKDAALSGDLEAKVRRRFIGLRSGATIEAMLAEANETEPSVQR